MVVEPGDPGAMAEALLAVLGASAVERGHLGAWLRNRALTLFTAQRMFDDYDDVYTAFEQSDSATPEVGGPSPASRADSRLARTGPWRMRSHDHRHGSDHRVR